MEEMAKLPFDTFGEIDTLIKFCWNQYQGAIDEVSYEDFDQVNEDQCQMEHGFIPSG